MRFRITKSSLYDYFFPWGKLLTHPDILIEQPLDGAQLKKEMAKNRRRIGWVFSSHCPTLPNPVLILDIPTTVLLRYRPRVQQRQARHHPTFHPCKFLELLSSSFPPSFNFRFLMCFYVVRASLMFRRCLLLFHSRAWYAVATAMSPHLKSLHPEIAVIMNQSDLLSTLPRQSRFLSRSDHERSSAVVLPSV